MTIFELRRLIESSVPAWVLLVPVALVLLGLVFHLRLERQIASLKNRDKDDQEDD